MLIVYCHMLQTASQSAIDVSVNISVLYNALQVVEQPGPVEMPWLSP